MRTFSVKNFAKFQHYKDRSPPWIKLYNELLDDYEFGRLQDASKMHLVAIWLLASRSDNELPYDPEWIGKRINATEPVDLDALVQAGFIVLDQPLHEPEQVASKPLAECLSRDRGEAEAEAEAEKEGGDAPPLKDQLFGPCLQWLIKRSGKPEKDCRNIIGKWISTFGDGEVIAVFIEAQRASPVEPIAWMFKALSERAQRQRAARGGTPAGGKPISVAEFAREWDAEFERQNRLHGGNA